MCLYQQSHAAVATQRLVAGVLAQVLRQPYISQLHVHDCIPNSLIISIRCMQQIFLNCGPVLAMAAFVIWAEARLHHTKYQIYSTHSTVHTVLYIWHLPTEPSHSLHRFLLHLKSCARVYSCWPNLRSRFAKQFRKNRYGRVALPGLLLGLSSCFYLVVAIRCRRAAYAQRTRRICLADSEKRK